MIHNDSIPVLVALTDRKLTHQILQKTKQKFPRLPLQMEVCDDGTRALQDFKQKHHPVLIVGQDLPGTDGATLVQEIRKLDGSVNILFLTPSVDEKFENVEVIKLPLVDWTNFLNRFQFAIPDDWKARFGLFERNSKNYSRLVEFGKKYERKTDPESINSGAILTIPVFFEEATVQGSSISSTDSLKSKSTSQFKTIYRDLDPVAKKRAVRFELGLLAILLTSTLSYYYFKRDEEIGMFSLTSLLMGLTLLSFFGFFLGRVLDKYVFSKSIQNTDIEEKRQS